MSTPLIGRASRSSRRSRRGAGRAARLLLLALTLGDLALFAYAPAPAAARAAAPQFVHIRGDQFYLNGERIVIKGSNYYQRNAPWAVMWRDWHGPQVEQEVAAGADRLGLNALRILVPYGEGHGWIDKETKEVNPEYLHRLREMVQIAGNHGLRVILTLFDFYDTWPAAGTAEEAVNLRYLATIVETFRDDDRVLAWDLHNEPDNYRHWTKNGRPDEVIAWLARMGAATRRLDPNHPVTIGLGNYRNHWLETGPNAPKIIDLVDFVSFHAYEAPFLRDQVREIKAKTGKPILLEETGWPSDPYFLHHGYNEGQQRDIYQTVLAVIGEEGLTGATQWLLWDLTAGRSLRAADIADWMGLFRWDGTIKPAGELYAAWPAPRLPATVTSQLPLTGQPFSEQDRPLYFPETNHFVPGRFKERWEKYGGLATFGLPLTEPFLYENCLIQFFERAVMEFWTEGSKAPGYGELTPDEQVRLSVPLWHLGRAQAEALGYSFPPAAPFAGDDRHWYFAETGHSLSEGFLDYWLRGGGLLQFGYPISEPFDEVSPTDGQTYRVQYFERARFEWHPEHAGTPYEVALGHLGREEMRRRGWLP